MENGIKEKMEHWKVLAELFLKEDKRVLIKDIDNNWYFADLILVGDDTLTIQCYAPSQRKGLKLVLYWALISSFEEVKKE